MKPYNALNDITDKDLVFAKWYRLKREAALHNIKKTKKKWWNIFK